MAKNTHTSTVDVTIDEVELVLDVTYVFHRGRPARLFGPPELCYEAEPAEVEVVKASVAGTDRVVDLHDDVVEMLSTRLLESHSEPVE